MKKSDGFIETQKNSSLRGQLKKLAFENPELRKHLVPILKEAATWTPPKINKSLALAVSKKVEKYFLQGILNDFITKKIDWREGLKKAISKAVAPTQMSDLIDAQKPIKKWLGSISDSDLVKIRDWIGEIQNKGKSVQHQIKPEAWKKASLREAAIFKYDGSPIKKPQLVRIVNKVIGDVSRGFFTDEHWRGPKKVWDALSVMGLDWDIMGSSYNGTMPPESKTWKFEIKFTNERGKPAKLYGHLVASGAGSVDDPLSRYDIVTYVS